MWMPPRMSAPPFLSGIHMRSEEHTSELQSHLNLVCRLLLEKKKKIHEILSHSNLVFRHGRKSELCEIKFRQELGMVQSRDVRSRDVLIGPIAIHNVAMYSTS